MVILIFFVYNIITILKGEIMNNKELKNDLLELKDEITSIWRSL